MIISSGLAVLYPHPIVLRFWEAAISPLLLGLITVLVIIARRRYPYLLVGWLWYLGTLFPVIGLIQVGIQEMAGRYTNIPMNRILLTMNQDLADKLYQNILVQKK